MAASSLKSAQSADPVVDDFISISVATLVPGASLGVRLFVRDKGSNGVRLYKSEELSFEQKDRDKLLSQGRRTLLIRKSDSARYQEYLRESLPSTLENESIPIVSRAACLSEVVRDVMVSTLVSGDTDAILEATEDLAETSVPVLARDDLMVHELAGVMHHDYHTFTHSTNVAFYAVMLARALGISDESELNRIAVGGFIHDLGKLDIADAILTKPDRLDEDELEVIRDHPRAGFRRLCHRDDLSFGQLMMVYQHHERIDGGGYHPGGDGIPRGGGGRGRGPVHGCLGEHG